MELNLYGKGEKNWRFKNILQTDIGWDLAHNLNIALDLYRKNKKILNANRDVSIDAVHS